MSPEDEPPARPRRERPLVAPGREPAPPTQPTPQAPPTVTTPPVGRPVIEFPDPVDEPEREDHVEVEFEGPARQRRWTIALRILLVIPHFAWLYLLGLASGVVLVVAWFAALFVGRVPTGMHRFLSLVAQYQARVTGYGFLLLTDAYPPFALADNDYAVNVYTTPGRLNRAAVFFRIILVIPTAILAGIAQAGVQFIGVFGWLLALIMGRLPTPLWQAHAAVLRYQTRAYAFAQLLTAEQATGLLGDSPGPGADVSGLPDLPERPRLVRLVLSKGAKRIVVLSSAAAVVAYVGMVIAIISLSLQVSGAFEELDSAHGQLEVATQQYTAETQTCAIEGGLPCLQDANRDMADAFDAFASELETISFPATVDVSVLIADALACAEALRALAQATDADSYGVALAEFQEAARIFDEHYAQIAFAVDTTV